MSLPLRILLGLAPQLALIGAVVVGAVTAYHGRADSGLFIGCVVVVLAAILGFVFAQLEFSFGWPAGLLMIFATLVLVFCTAFGVRERVLHDRGRDADCQITSFTEEMLDVTSYNWVYGLSCHGDGPPALTEAKSGEPRQVGSRVTVRYDPAQTSIVSAGSGGGDGQGLFVLAGLAAAVLLLAGLAAAVLD
ncbi:hypothetical protein JNUCC0626_09870 [Lentzea sp. JNUCC 0626]|uniref:hypothetical protein n=1 Tax=Lentzea sp. JNUCC 0626 TaxID=3367513 RepID=UPI003748FA34